MEPRVLDQLLEATALLQQDLAHYFENTPLTTARTHLLWELRRCGPSTQQVLATGLGVSPRNVTGLVDALEESGYVLRQPHPSDRRAIIVSLTELGVRTMADMESEHRALSTTIVADLAEDDVARLEQSLGMVIGRLRAIVTESAPSERAEP